MDLVTIVQQIEEKKRELDALRPISPEREAKIKQTFRLWWNYHSNAIEGNQLTLGETITLILHDLTAKGKSYKDHREVKGHNEALLWVEDIVEENRPLTQNFIRELHEMILKESYDSPAITPLGQIIQKKIKIGAYKTTPNHVKTPTGEIFYYAEPEDVVPQMTDLLQWYDREKIDTHPLILAATFHYRFVKIHPFDDGNGRMSRILMNLVLMRGGYPPAIIKMEKRNEYLAALREADAGNIEKFILFVGESLLESVDLYVRGAKGENIGEEDDLDKKIALLKLQLKNQKKKQNKFITAEFQEKIFSENLNHLITKLIFQLHQFNDMFFSDKHTIEFSNMHLSDNGIHAYNTYLKYAFEMLKPNEIIKNINIIFTWNKFKYNGGDYFDLKRNLFISFNSSGYSLEFENSQKVVMLYPNQLSQKEINQIVTHITESILEEIQQKTNTKLD